VIVPAPPALPDMDVAGRLTRLRAALEADAGAGGGALLVTGLVNVRYLTGFTGSAGMLAVLPGDAVLVTDGRYEVQGAQQLGAAGVAVRLEVAPAVRQRDVLAGLMGRAGVSRVALEAAHVTWSEMRRLAEGLPGVELVASEGLVEALRQVKDAGELARMERAAGIADRALAAVRPLLHESPTEAELALALDTEMRRLGADGPAFETICASGANGAKPHHRPSSRVIEAGDAVVLDFGAAVDGYRSDMTRTLAVGEVARGDLRRALEVVTRSQAAGVAAVRSGVATKAVDDACRRVIAGEGWGDRFVHGTGHGVGLDIHEAPSVAATSTDTLAAGHVVTVEPGVYLPGVGGVRVEDTLAVTGGGCVPLTRYPKDL
jgi:Xaa-Pro aminopeptidase